MPFQYGLLKVKAHTEDAAQRTKALEEAQDALRLACGPNGAVMRNDLPEGAELCFARQAEEGTAPLTLAFMQGTALPEGKLETALEELDALVYANLIGQWFFAANTARRSTYQKDLETLAALPQEKLDRPVQERLALLLSYRLEQPEQNPGNQANASPEAAEKAPGKPVAGQPANSTNRRPLNKPMRIAEETLQTVRGLSGAAEFKAYMEELEAMRPYLTRWNGRDSFPNQHLLFAVDPGSGCTTALRLLHQYLGAAGLYKGSDKTDVSNFGFREEIFHIPDNLHVNPEGVLDEFENAVRYAKPGLIGIHIESFVNNLDGEYFVKMLDICWENHDSIIFVFVVPFMDEGALARIHARLADKLNLRLLKFPPFTDEELIKAAKHKLLAYDIEWDDSADRCFRHALALERGDQRFYGMQTVDKLATELLLMKVRNNALKKTNAPEHLLTDEDFKEYLGEEDDGLSGFEKLDALIGLEQVKQRVREIVAAVKAQKKMYELGSEMQAPCYHMMFTGSPGTGKTVVARIVGQIFRENGLLPIGDLIEVGRWDMVGEYIGQTAPKTVALCRSAHGSVMFIDEAYMLDGGRDNNRDFGKEAIGALIAEMENGRDRFVVIMAGYEDDMQNLLKVNSGLKDRVPHHLHFENYDREQLFAIFEMQIKNKYTYDQSFLDTAKDFFHALEDSFIEAKEFGNGRFVRNVTERVRIKALLRYMGEDLEVGAKLHLLPIDFETAVTDEDLSGINKKEKKLARLGFGSGE